MKVERGYADVNGTSLYYEAAGYGHPLVLTHGGALDLRMWDDQFRLFARRYRVVRYDVRGYGKSALPTQEGYRRPDDLKTLMDYLEIESAYIVGLSMGGGISIEFALAYPSATDALVPIGSGLSGYQRSDEWLGLLERRKAVSDEAGVQAARDFWLNTYVFSPALERLDVSARVVRMVSDYSGFEWTDHDPFAPLDPPAMGRLGEIRAPTLVLVSERDIPDCLKIAEYLRRHIPRAKKVVLPGVGHMSNMEDPDRFNETLLDFLEGI